MYRSILVGSDGSSTAAIAVDRAAALARAFDATLTLVSVGPLAKSRKVIEAESRRLGDAVRDIATLAKEGDPAEVLVAMADSGDFDLLVVGNKGMQGIGRFFSGSVPNKVSHHETRCALLIVRTT